LLPGNGKFPALPGSGRLRCGKTKRKRLQKFFVKNAGIGRANSGGKRCSFSVIRALHIADSAPEADKIPYFFPRKDKHVFTAKAGLSSAGEAVSVCFIHFFWNLFCIF